MTEIDELLQAGAGGHKRARQDVKTDSGSGGWQGSGQGDKAMHEEIFLSSWLREERKDKEEK